MTRPHAIWLVAGASVLGVIALFTYLMLPAPSVAIAETNEPHEPVAAIVSTELVGEPWCASELEAFTDACFAMPHELRIGAPLIVYLHGRYSPESAGEERDRQTRLAKLATARGFAVLAIHGKQGQCATPELASYWCWPSNERNADDGPLFAANIEHTIALARKRLGKGSNVLLGFSNGAYFATLIATRALAAFDAIVIAHGGPVEPTSALGATPPILLLTADDDASDAEMRKLDGELSSAHWPHVMTAREGGHALPDWDIDTALQFFSRVRTEPLPLVPPLPNRSRGSVRSASAEISADGGLELRDF